MNAIFAGTHFFIALLSDRDEAHDRAVELGERHAGELVTTAWVLTELANTLSRIKDRGLFGETLEILRNDPRTTPLCRRLPRFSKLAWSCTLRDPTRSGPWPTVSPSL